MNTLPFQNPPNKQLQDNNLDSILNILILYILPNTLLNEIMYFNNIYSLES